MKTIASWFFSKDEVGNTITEQFVPGIGSGYSPATSVISVPSIPPPLFIPNKTKKTNQEIVKEIHEKIDWYALYVKDIKKDEIQKKIDAVQLIHDTTLDKIKLRSSLGFALSPAQEKEKLEAEREIANMKVKITLLEKEREERKILNDLRIKYPQGKFVHFDDLLEVCSKYNLALGYTKDYIGDIPDKNLFEIRDYKKLDEAIDIFTVTTPDYDYTQGYSRKINVESTKIGDPYREPIETKEKNGTVYWIYKNYVSEEIAKILIPENDNKFKKTEKGWFKVPNNVNIINTFLIACPSQDLKKKINDVTVSEVKDPIVLTPVGHKNVFQIVSKWGDEAKEFVNPIHN